MPLPFRPPLPVDQTLQLVALSLTPFGRRRNLGDELRAGRSAAAILDRILAARPADTGVDRGALLSRAALAIERARDRDVQLITWADPSYPAALSAIADPPPVLWIRGSRDALTGRAVAIVGSRAGSEYGLAVAERLAADLASRRIVVVSGLARGIDSAAHRGALAAKGTTLA